MSKFLNSRTVEQFKAEKGISKIFFNYAVRKDANGVNQPIFINDETGKATGIQAVACQDEAGNTIAWCSRAVAEEIAKGQSITAKPLSVVDVYSDSNEPLGTKLVHPKSNHIEGLSL